MNLAEAQQQLAWPSPERILAPSGGGMAHLASIARAKIEAPLTRFALSERADSTRVRTGLLSANPESEKTEAPLALVCEFNKHVSIRTLLEAHRLAWNFTHAPVLVTLEPSRVLLWSCSVRPVEAESNSLLDQLPPGLASRLISLELQDPDDELASLRQSHGLETDAANALHWVNLLAGSHFSKSPDAFKPAGRLDETLIQNLLVVRDHLRDELNLPESRCHDLLARLIFIQFLFQRTDSSGRAALHADRLRSLQKEGVLHRPHARLEDLLADYEDSYRFFRWLNEKFNGDLFPGKAETPEEREKEWAEEKQDVKASHLAYLSRFISGAEDMRTGQGFLWRNYAFDVIPLELISSIYEMFVGPPEKDKAYYTPGRMVDFMLDAVLPWKGERVDLKVIDPSCGSGIFLVKSFQRLAHRLRSQLGDDLKPSDLRNLLSGQIFGVDINPEAVRVAAFSLYLTFCDELDPRHYWSREKLLPLLRGKNLLHQDFFAEQFPAHTEKDAKTYDLVIGNAPWGKSSAKDSRSDAKTWAKNNGWTIPYRDHGPVFLAKAARLAKPDGWVSMIQPGGLLLNRSEPTRQFREKLLSSYAIDEVINLSAIRREIFAKAIGACCVVTFKPEAPQPDAEFAYVTPKPQANTEDGIRIVIESHDIHFVRNVEAIQDDLVWSALMWGGRRDLELIRRLSKLESLENLRGQGKLATREGVIRGSRKKLQPVIVDRRFFGFKRVPENIFLSVDAETLPINDDPQTDGAASTNFEAFEPPQLLFKQSWRADSGRFDAVMVKPDSEGRGVLCSDSYVSVRDLQGGEEILAGLWALLRSSFAPFWFQLTGGKFAGGKPNATETEFRKLPAIRIPKSHLSELVSKGPPAIDETVLSLLSLTPAERILVEDLHRTVLPDAQRQGGKPPGVKAVNSEELKDYAIIFLKVLSSTYGSAFSLKATVFRSANKNQPPAQIIAIERSVSGPGGVNAQKIQEQALHQQLEACYKTLLDQPRESIGYQRIVEVLLEREAADGPSRVLFLIKPPQRRYWLRSLAMRDADRLGPLLFSSLA